VGRLPHLGRLHLNEISQVLKEKYFLHLRRLDPANYRYRDPYYDEKRLWVCRLVAQFLMDGALVVSIDETHFRHDALKRRAWQFHPHKVDILKRAESRRQEGQRRANRRKGWGEVSEEVSVRSLQERNISRRKYPAGGR